MSVDPVILANQIDAEDVAMIAREEALSREIGVRRVIVQVCEPLKDALVGQASRTLVHAGCNDGEKMAALEYLFRTLGMELEHTRIQKAQYGGEGWAEALEILETKE